jgi:hypothetical protein
MVRCMLRVVTALVILMPSAALAAACAPGTLQDYINAGATPCEIGDLAFADFELAPTPFGATPIDPSVVQVTPTATASTAELIVTVNAAAGAGQFLDSFFRFGVTALATSHLFGHGGSLTDAAATGDGVVTLINDVCADGTFLGIEPIGCSGTPGTIILFADAFDAVLTDAASTPVATFFDVFADIGIDGGLAGTASLASGTLRFFTAPVPAPAPEPASAWLLTLGLALLLAARPRRRIRPLR